MDDEYKARAEHSYKDWSAGSLALRYWRNEQKQLQIRQDIRKLKYTLEEIQADQHTLTDLLLEQSGVPE